MCDAKNESNEQVKRPPQPRALDTNLVVLCCVLTLTEVYKSERGAPETASMVSLGLRIASWLLRPLWRRALEDEDPSLTGVCELRRVCAGVVTHLGQDHGLIDHSVHFSFAVVLGGALLRLGDSVQALAVRDGDHGQWRALRVERLKDSWDSGQQDSAGQDKPRSLIGTVTSCDQEGGYINQNTYFPRQALCEGFQPVKGDWVLAHYVVSSEDWSCRVQQVSPLRYKRMDNVCVSFCKGDSGVLEDSVFFSLDSVLLPPGFRPTRGDQVNAVILESSQSLCSWRAICMTPVKRGYVPAVGQTPHS
ncbi:hypothetical protein DNTS_033521 [Danionella cerebrum]|uniref:S1-like RNA binding domain-containing protein n=1 Tax=Danionella cerebrum TaxID=2873325 RepID=A0A553NHX8_9TELE|nr:hypothetical protein DNTS_033521 [Danionella translucida]